MPGDEDLLEAAVAGIKDLNHRYNTDAFYLFHRRRLWNPKEGVWMGWERKRGKLHEFNWLLRGHSDTSYDLQLGNLDRLQCAGNRVSNGVSNGVAYVITLDADTILPRSSALTLVGTLAHPLNQALFDPQSDKVIAGYTILQPRTEIKPTSANQSLFTRVFAGDTGLDLYTLAVSDVYQDLFGEGIYVGKGIYDVDAFERSLRGRVPENTLLSHDLFEGIHGRVGLVTDVVLYEDYPSHYLVNVRRSHRWVRGDWQLLPWLLPWIPGAGGWTRNELDSIDRWKIADNLRRSLLPPALLLLFAAGWIWLPGSPLVWTIFGVLTPAVSVVTSIISGLIQSLSTASLRQIVRPVRDSIVRWLLFLAFLPYETLLTLDAVAVTLMRVLFTRKHLLQWTTAAHTARFFGREVSAEVTHRQMVSSLALAVTLGLIVYFTNPRSLPLAIPLLLLWLLAPEIAYWISRPDRREVPELSEAQRNQLRRLARRTWLFFEQFVGPDDNWLPPDHFQESPRGTVAHRTSPTNVGLYLVTILAAYDLGYISTMNLALRLRSTFDTLDKLDRYRGHFLNWIDTSSLAPLTPRYVSTVDSGNLAACLLLLKQACVDEDNSVAHQPAFRWQRWQGLLDTLALLDETMSPADEATPPEAAADVKAIAPLQSLLDDVRQRINAVRHTPEQWLPLLRQLNQEELPRLERLLLELAQTSAGSELALTQSLPKGKGPSSEQRRRIDAKTLRGWRIVAERLRRALHGMQREVDLFLPWLLPLSQPPALFRQPVLSEAEGMKHPARPLPDTELAEAWQALCQALQAAPAAGTPLPPTPSPRLNEVASICAQGRTQLARLQELLSASKSPDESIRQAIDWCTRLDAALGAAQTTVESILIGFAELGQQAGAYVEAMDFRFLFDRQRQVFHIGYNLDAGSLDNNYYDLLASEARIASLVAIAKNDVPQSHWLHVARPLTRVDEGQVLLSWSGTMFEYLMPSLFMQSFEGTLLHQSCDTAVARQINYGKERGVPWGISESGFYTFDAAMNYQYRAFGVPDLGLKRGLADDLVISPYASMMALPIRPQAVMENIDHLARRTMLGRYGLYEAIDFTSSRLALGQEAAIVRSYMSHHQAMIMMALANYLQKNTLVRRFHAEPCIQSVELLLQEQIPPQAPLEYPHGEENVSAMRPAQAAVAINPWDVPVSDVRWDMGTSTTPMPLVHYLSNGRYSTLITNAGAGYSHWQQGDATTALTRWRADTTQDDWGVWFYIQDRDSGALWSATMQPTLTQPESQRVRFHAHMAEFRRRQHDITLEMTITVAPDDDVEIRRLNLANENDRPRRLRLTTYGEVVLAPPAADLRHPAFTKLFVESEYLPEYNALLFRRRPRSAEEKPQYLVHMLVVGEGQKVTGAYESDRVKFLGRSRTAHRPAALGQSFEDSGQVANDQWLSATVGATLDPIMALGQDVELGPQSTIQVAAITLAAGSRQAALTLAERYQAWAPIDRAFRQAHTHAESELRQLSFTTPDLEQTQQLLSLLLYPHPSLRASPPTLAANRKGQPALWTFGISGDHPILLLRLHDESEGELLPALLRAHIYWRRRGLTIDLVILNEQESHYGQSLQGYIHRMIQRMNSDHWLNRRGGIFILRRDQIAEVDQRLLQTTASAILDSAAGPLSQQLASLLQQPAPLPAFVATLDPREVTEATPSLPRPADLQFDNGLGGFSADGRHYVIYLEPGETTPAPWVNVIANPDFGFLVSESGAGFTWAVNSGENRLTSWRNDPITDMPSEVVYLRDEETAEIWSPTPQPAPAEAPYLIRHGAGYSTFEHHSHNLKQRLRFFIAPDAPVKVIQLHLENTAPRPRRLTATFYAEWVLGTHHQMTQQTIVPEYEKDLFALLARNAYNVEFGQRVAFVAASKEPHGLTANRAEFLGRLGTLRRPAALGRIGLSSHVQAGLDTCAAIQLHIDLEPGATEEVYFLLGQGADRDQTIELIRQYQDPERVAAAWQTTQDLWEEILGAVSVNTPDPAMNLLLNRWLLYQALACRIWGRSALYQSSGAYGFRDQLQDVMSLIYARPQLTRQHILRAAAHQFEAGDVLHWWHPPSGRGVRTRITDDLIWLPYVTAYYIAATGDESILDERVPFRQGKPLAEDEEERYGYYEQTEEHYTLYDHCRRALRKGTTEGRHGLPLMGGGDWNDGMNRVGIHGKGESIWLGWFLYDTLTQFADLCQRLGKVEQAEKFRQQAADYRQALEINGWDGQWYRRAYYDDGTPLGSSLNRECQIDSIAQSWSILSGAATGQRAQQAMHAVLDRLVKGDERLILLFTPPFDKTPKDPGYIKGYLPGIRENGGQYTHAALWAIWAFAHLGDADLAESLFKLINPIYRAETREKAELYKVEPYVIAADVYGVEPHVGRGGWTWYTGSSGWMYRLGVEAILGLQRTRRGLRLDPRIPKEWSDYTITYRYGQSTYEIRVENPDHVNQGVKEIVVDGQKQDGAEIPLQNDGRAHHVRVILGASA
ncbi:MAG TPA: glucoamylase family protein [Anaerolineae bacterium]